MSQTSPTTEAGTDRAPVPPCDVALIGSVVTSERGPFTAEVTIRSGRIEGVHEPPTYAPARRRIELGNKLLLPGFVDAHVHLGSTPVDSPSISTAAAAAGGVTTIVDMPFDRAGVVHTGDRLAEKATSLAGGIHVDVALLATVLPTAPLDGLTDLVAAGACGIVVSLFEQDPERYPRIGAAALHELMEAAAQLQITVSLHPEADELIRPRLRRAHAESKPGGHDLHAWTRPPVSELYAVVGALELALDSGARFHLHQVSLERSHELVGRYRSDGADVTAEALVHYLMLSANDAQRLGVHAKTNPPIRSGENLDRLWDRLSRHAIDVIASDHTPWPASSKNRPHILDNESGGPSIDIYASLVLAEAQARRVPLHHVVRAASREPARIFGLHSKGDIQPGKDADLFVFDPEREWHVDASVGPSRAGWSPYDGRSVTGKVTQTWLRGQEVCDGHQTSREPQGRPLLRTKGSA